MSTHTHTHTHTDRQPGASYRTCETATYKTSPSRRLQFGASLVAQRQNNIKRLLTYLIGNDQFTRQMWS